MLGSELSELILYQKLRRRIISVISSGRKNVDEFKVCKIDHWGDPGADGRIVLRCVFKKWDVGLWTGSSWLRIGTGGGHL
jgi:hypothetical protein